MSFVKALKKLEVKFTEPIVEEVLLRYYAKYRNVKQFFKVLREALPEKRFGFLKTNYHEKVNKAESLVEDGVPFEDALYKAELIGEDSYYLIKNAIQTGSLEQVLERKKEADKVFKEQFGKLAISLIFPSVAFLLLIPAMYMAIYKLYANLRGMVNFGDELFYRILDFFVVDEKRYFVFVSIIFVLIFIAFLLRRKLPLLKGIFFNLEKLKFFSYLSVGLRSGARLYELLERYTGFFKNDTEQIVMMAKAGEDLKKAFIFVMGKYLSPIEKANLVAGLESQERQVSAQVFEEAFRESLRELEKQLAKFSSIATVVTLTTIGLIIYIIFIKIYLQVYTVINSQLSM
jgi:type II secretory pathway component PulF